MVCKFEEQTCKSEFESHWVPHSFGLVLHLSKKLSKLLLFLQLLKLSLVSQQHLSYLKIFLVDLVNGLINTTVNSSGFLLQKNHFEVLNAQFMLDFPGLNLVAS